MPPTAVTVADLPVEPDALQAFALEQNRLARALWEQLEILQHQIAQLNRARFGVSSERLAGQAELFDAATDIPVPPVPDAVPVAGHTRKGRPALPKELPRTCIEYDLSDEQKMAFDTLERIGEERSETLHYEPSRLTVIEHIRFKYVVKKDGESTIVTASAQPSPLPKSNASASLLANVLVNTYVDHLPLNRQEIRIVNLIYNWFIDESLNEYEIASRLNGMRVRTDLDREWTRATVREVLTNEKYIGNNVYNRVSFKLKKMRVVNTPDMLIRKEGAFQSIIPSELFYTAQGIMRARARRYSNEELIERLRNLYRNRGFLSGVVIDETEGMPSTSVYVYRFGSLIRAYQSVGFTPGRDYRYLETNRFLRQLHPEIVAQTEKKIADLGGAVHRDPATDVLTVNNEFTACLVLARCQTHDDGRNHWKVRFDTSLLPDITVAVRLDHSNAGTLDYYLLPRLDFGNPRINLADRNPIEFESYRFDTLEYLYGMAERARLRRVA